MISLCVCKIRKDAVRRDEYTFKFLSNHVADRVKIRADLIMVFTNSTRKKDIDKICFFEGIKKKQFLFKGLILKLFLCILCLFKSDFCKRIVTGFCKMVEFNVDMNVIQNI